MAVTSVIAAETWDNVAAADCGDLHDLDTTRRWDGTVDSIVTGHDGTGKGVKGLNEYEFFYGTGDGFKAFVVSFWWRVDSDASDTQVCQVSDGTFPQIALGRNIGGLLEVNTESLTWTGTDQALSISTWYHIEFAAFLSATVGAFDVRVDGVAVAGLSQSGVDTVRDTASTSSDDINFNGGANAYLDECVIKAHTAAYEADDLVSGADGAGSRVAALLPVALSATYPGTGDKTTGWADEGGGGPTVGVVNESPAVTDGTGFIETQVQNARVSFTLDDLPEDADSVLTAFYGMWGWSRVGGEQLVAFVRTGGSDTDGSAIALTGVQHRVWEFSGPWTVADINAMEIGGMRNTGFNTDELRVAHFELQVAYLIPAAAEGGHGPGGIAWGRSMGHVVKIKTILNGSTTATISDIHGQVSMCHITYEAGGAGTPAATLLNVNGGDALLGNGSAVAAGASLTLGAQGICHGDMTITLDAEPDKDYTVVLYLATEA